MVKLPSRRRFSFVLLLLLLIVLSISPAFSTFAQEGNSSQVHSLADAALPIGEEVSLDRIQSETVRLSDGRILVTIELAQAPAVDSFLQAGGEAAGAVADSVAASQAAVVEQAQASLLSNIASAGIGVEQRSSTSFVLNSITVAISPDQLQQLRQLPGVEHVFPVLRVERDTSTSIPFIGSTSAWNGSLGAANTGSGIVISIIDSGVDYSHTHFGGDGTWPTNPALRTTITGGAGEDVFPNAKVVGGYDYVGDAFNLGNPEGSGLPVVETPSPDPDPIDCSIRPADLTPTFGSPPAQAPSGHGSHVAGIAGGYGVNGDGTTYTGGYISVPFGSLRIGPGTAPGAQLLAMRVFGCFGSTSSDLVIAAIDDSVSGARGAVADVINMSLGSPFGYGGDDPALSPYVTAINNATAAGVVVVASAGNNYDTFYTTGSPGSTGTALSVASTLDGGYNGIQISGTSTDGLYPASNSVGAPVVSVVGPAPVAVPAGNGCTAANYSTFPAGRIAVVQFTSGCGSAGLATAARGAPNPPLGLLVISNTPFGFQNLACTAGTPYIPCMSIEASTGALINANLATVQIRLDPTYVVTAGTLADTISTFSSRGPRRGDTASGIKPDVAAPGDSITSTGAGTGNGPQNLGGTSMAAPTVAGMVALIQANPAYASWTANQIKALVMNTANHDVFFGTTSGAQVSPQRAGTGRVDVVNALSTQVIAYNTSAPQLVGVSFGDPEVPAGDTQTFNRQVTVENRGTGAVTYNVAVDTVTNSNIASFSVSPTTITVPAGGSVTVTVTLIVNPPVSGTPPFNNGDPSLSLSQVTGSGTLPRHFLSEEGALLILTPTAGSTVPLRVQLYAAPRAASFMRAETAIVLGGTAGTTNVPLSGIGVNTGTAFPQDIVSVVTALKLTGQDPVGDAAFPLPELDLQYVGATSNFNNGGNTAGSVNADTYASIGLSTAADWSTPNEYFIFVYIDANEDGFGTAADDFLIFTSAPTITGTSSRSDVFFSYVGLASLGSGFAHDYLNGVSAGFNTYVFNNNVVNLAFYPGVALNYDNNPSTPVTPMLPAGNTNFNFYVETVSRATGDTIDVSSVMSFDLANPILDTHVAGVLPSDSLPIWDDVPGNNIPLNYDLTTYTPDPATPLALLLLHHHNVPAIVGATGAEFRRAEVVTVGSLPVNQNLLTNGDFSAGLAPWFTFGQITSQITGGVFEFYRNVGGESAVIVQNTAYDLPAGAGLEAQVDLGNSSSVRKRGIILLHSNNFSDLQVCSFWIAPNTPLQTYTMRSYTTQAWDGTSMSIYVSPDDGQGFLRVDNAVLRYRPGLATDVSGCVDPSAPPPAGGADGSNLVVNGGFSAGLSPWFTFGQIVSQINGGVFEFYRPAGTPAGVVAQYTGATLPPNLQVQAQFDLGNSSSVRKRATVILHDFDFTDLQVCTFWIPPGTPLQSYAMRTHTTDTWTNATLSVYAATVGTEQWIRLDNASLVARPSLNVIGTECYEPSSAGGLDFVVPEVFAAEATEVPTETAPAYAVVESDSADVARTGEWEAMSEPAGASGESYLINTSPDASLTLRFIGTGASVAYVAGPSFGGFSVEVDGAAVQSVITTAEEYGFTQLIVANLTEGEHVLRVVPDGVVAIDAFSVAEVLPPEIVTSTPEVTAEITPEVTATETATAVVTETVTEVPTQPTTTATATATATPFPLTPPAIANMDDGATDWLATVAWQLRPEAAFGGSGLGWQVLATTTQVDRLRWDRWIDLRTVANARLSFQSLLSQGDSTGVVQVSIDGVTWQPVAQVLASSTWTSVEVDLSLYAGQLVQLEFVWNGVAPVDANDLVVDSWQLDSVVVQAVEPTAQPTATETPTLVPTATETATEVPTVIPTATPLPTEVPIATVEVTEAVLPS